MRVKVLCLVLILCIGVCGCSDSSSNIIGHEESPLPVTEDDSTSTALVNDPLPVMDYIDVLKESDKYDGMTISVAGRISDLSKNGFKFMDRAGFEEACLGFSVDLAQSPSVDKTAEELYTVGECVCVNGVWHSGFDPRLKEAEIVSVGADAQKYVESFEKQWEEKGKYYAETLPITDYMDIVESPDSFDGKRVRTAGKIQAVGTNAVTRDKYFSFRDRQTNYTNISFSLIGCPGAMQDLCVEDEFVVLSGIVHADIGFPSVSECYIECVGEEAEIIEEQSKAQWKQRWNDEREEFLETCNNTYSYEELARYPRKYEGEKIVITGTVLQTDIVWGDNVVLLNVGQGDLVYINYVGKQNSDPEILQDDRITFYGECANTKTYTTVLGNDNTVPYIIALYSSINQ